MRFEDSGEAGLLDRRLGQASDRRVPVEPQQQIETLYRTRHSGFTAKHFHEHLVREHTFSWGYTWPKVFLQSRGLLPPAKTRAAHRRKRDLVGLSGARGGHRLDVSGAAGGVRPAWPAAEPV